jgi:penicillin-insensitive murein DD-endopeptidase
VIVKSFAAVLLLCLAAALPASAQETAGQQAVLVRSALSSLPPSAARRAFGAETTPAAGEPHVVGEYWKGCFFGGEQMPAVGDHWQVMRLSRGRSWGTPRLVAFLERFSKTAAEATGWPGILIGDMSQPRGGPMLTGHASHQLGIESDIWLRPMPKTPFARDQVDEVLSADLVRDDGRDVDPRVYNHQHLALLRAAAMQPEVARVFVNAAIKKALCRDAGTDRTWLRKIRPAAGHSYHFHIRLACPPGEGDCIEQAPPADDDGCRELASWLKNPPPKAKPGVPVAGTSLPMSAMPTACQAIVRPASPGRPVAPLELARERADAPAATRPGSTSR